jgi:hypothetical protein
VLDRPASAKYKLKIFCLIQGCSAEISGLRKVLDAVYIEGVVFS